MEINLKEKNTKKISNIKAKLLINASGPWLNQVLETLSIPKAQHVKLIQGSHIIVPQLYQGDHAYILQNPDNRIVFVIPYQHQFTLIGTTEVEYKGDPGKAVISNTEIIYLCDAVNRYFKIQISPKNIIHTFSGVRPLQQEESTLSAISRDYKLELLNKDSAAFLNIIGGKITTYRRLTEHAMELIQAVFNKKTSAWTANVPLPGGDIPDYNLNKFIAQLETQYPWLSHAICDRYAHCYGTYSHKLLQHCRTLKDLGEYFGNTLYQNEIDYLINNEWATTAEDILWRRTKLGLLFSKKDIDRLDNYLKLNILKS